MSDIKVIESFIQRHHVVGLACYANEDLWAANCFYLYDAVAIALMVITDPRTRHGQLMQKQPKVAGTICSQNEVIDQLQGVQFTGYSEQLTINIDYWQQEYQQRFQIALPSPCFWRISLQQLKMVDNKVAFAHKWYWQREQLPT